MTTKKLFSFFWASQKMLAALVFFCSMFVSQGQNLYQSRIGGSADDVACSVTTSWERGLVFGGYTESCGAGGRDILTCLFNITGNVNWVRTFGTPLNEECNCIIKTSDKGYLMVGSIQTDSNSTDALVVKTDQNGNVEWAKRFGGTGADYASHAIETDSSFFVVGNNGSYGGSYTDIFLISLKKTGEMRFSKIYGGSNHDSGVDIFEADNGNIILTGGTRSYNGDTYQHDFYWMETDVDGTVLNMKVMGGNGIDGGFSIVQAIGGGYVLTGYTTNPSTSDEDIMVVKLSQSGSVLWAKKYGGTGYDGGTRILQNDDQNGYLVFGYMQSFGMGNTDIFLMSIDTTGVMNWTKTIGSGQEEGLFFKHKGHLGISKVGNGKYAFADYTNGLNSNGLKDVYCGVISGSGVNCGNTMDVTPPTSSLSLHEYAVTETGTFKYDSASVVLTVTLQAITADTVCYYNNSGLAQYTEQISPEVFPVPAQDVVFISVPDNNAAEVQIEVLANDGRLMKKETYDNSGDRYSLDISEFSSGCYFLRITYGNNHAVKKLLILK